MPMTAAQLITQALTIAKCPGYVLLGGQQLNLVLNDLCMKRNLKANLVTDTITATAYSNGPFNLEANYLRTYDLFYLVSGEPYFLEPCSLREFDSEDQLSGVSNYPYEWASDLSGVPNGTPGLLYIYPQSSTGVTMTHRYYLKQPEIVNPQSSATIPWFADQDYLLTALAARMMKITDDDRKESFLMDAERILEPYLMMEGDEQQVVKEVRLDPRRFHIGGSNRPTKLDPY